MGIDPTMSGMAATAAVAASPSVRASAWLSKSRIAVTATTSSVRNFFHNAQIRYIGYLPWTRGCALGGCYGNFGDYGGCYWREVPVADGRGGWVRAVEKICN